jgi:flagellar basal body-associated protein FliL
MGMKKIIISSFIVVVVIAVVTVLLNLSSPRESNYRLHLVVDSWSESDIDYPEEEFDFENITLNKTYVIPGDNYYELREFKVVKVDKSSITIYTSIPLSNKEDGTIDLNSKKRRFVIEDGKTLSLDTLTMDAGEWYEFTLIEKE